MPHKAMPSRAAVLEGADGHTVAKKVPASHFHAYILAHARHAHDWTCVSSRPSSQKQHLQQDEAEKASRQCASSSPISCRPERWTEAAALMDEAARRSRHY